MPRPPSNMLVLTQASKARDARLRRVQKLMFCCRRTVVLQILGPIRHRPLVLYQPSEERTSRTRALRRRLLNNSPEARRFTGCSYGGRRYERRGAAGKDLQQSAAKAGKKRQWL